MSLQPSQQQRHRLLLVSAFVGAAKSPGMLPDNVLQDVPRILCAWLFCPSRCFATQQKANRAFGALRLADNLRRRQIEALEFTLLVHLAAPSICPSSSCFLSASSCEIWAVDQPGLL